MKSILCAWACVALTISLTACSSSDEVEASVLRLEPACVDDVEELELTDWLCPEPLSIECVDGHANVDTIFVQPGDDLPAQSCEDIALSVNAPGPFPLGSHEIVVTAEAEDERGNSLVERCTAELQVVDTEPPVAGEERVIELWPPNHKMHSIAIEDCADVRDACDQELEMYFLGAGSDEPANDIGDGNTEPDIILSCDEAQIRAERQGPEDGRVYTLSWRAVDDEGLAVEGTCRVTVPHDQSGRPAVGGEPSESSVTTSDCGE
jgi:hypothetical protein